MSTDKHELTVEFRNVTITVGNVQDAKEAYAKLCNALASIEGEFDTDTYVAYKTMSEYDDSPGRSTEELFPDQEEQQV